MSDYTPSVGYFREFFAVESDGAISLDEARAEFDRMIAKVRAEVLREFARSIPGDVHDPRHVADLARGVADHIEEEAGLT